MGSGACIEQNKGAIGFNLFSNAARKQTMEKARDAGDDGVTPRIRLVQETEQEEVWGVLYTVPVFNSRLPAKSLARGCPWPSPLL